MDPDSRNLQTGGSDGITKPPCLMLYYNGSLKSRANVLPNTTNNYGWTFNPGGYDPSWFTGF